MILDKSINAIAVLILVIGLSFVLLSQPVWDNSKTATASEAETWAAQQVAISPVSCTPPSFSVCPSTTNGNTGLGVCTAIVNYTATATGSPAPTLSYVFSGATTGSGSGTGSGSTFNLGTTTVTITATNGCNPNSTCVFNVIVVDDDGPVLDCADDVTINTTFGLCTGTSTLTEPMITDNCSFGGNGLDFGGDNDYISFPTNILSTSTNFTYEAWIYVRSHANWARILDFGDYAGDNMFFTSSIGTSGIPRFVINVNGAGERQLTAPSQIVLNTWMHIAVTLSGTTATMYINGIQVAQNTSFNQNPSTLGATTNNWIGKSQYADAYLNGKMDDIRFWNVARTQSQIQSNMNKELIGNETGLVAYYKLNQGVAGGNNTGINTASPVLGPTGTLQNFTLNGSTSNWVSGALGSLSHNAPSLYPIGNTIVTWTATDAYGNTNSCQQTVTVVDNQLPVINCNTLTAVNLFTEAPNCNNETNVSVPVATDNCSGNINGVGTRSDLASINAAWPLGTTTITWTFTDAAMNSTTCTQNVIVNDNDPPTFSCPADLTVNTNDNTNCEVTVPDVLTGIADETDNCSAVTLTQSPTSGSAQTGVADGGTFQITVTATDGATPSNSSTCVVTVTVNDDDAPVITLIGATTIHVCKNNNYSDPGATAEDNCDGDLTGMIVADNPVNTAIPDSYTVTYDVMDAAGNPSSQVSRTVVVHELPVPVCTADFNACRTGGNINLIGATPTGGTYSGTGVSGNVFNPLVAGLGIHTIQYDYTDGYGCMGSCTFDITVFEAPILNVNDGMYYCTITDALAATMTQDGDVIEIPAGMYNDPCILINKSVIIRPVGGMVSIQCLEMNGDDKIMVLDGNLTIVQLTLSDGLIRTNGNNLKCGSISGGSASSYVVTD